MVGQDSIPLRGTYPGPPPPSRMFREVTPSTRRGAPLVLGAMVSKDPKSVPHSPGIIGFVRRVLQILEK